MSLLITILKAPKSVVMAELSKTFNSQGGTIGRGNDNFWVLDDPERFLSTHHCLISYENGQYYLTDKSTNGTFYNGSPDPMGKGTKLPISDQDTFIVGDYDFSFKVLDSSVQPGIDEEFPSSPFANDNLDSSSDFGSSPFASGHISSSDSLIGNNSVETDPLAALDKAQGGHDALAPEINKDPGADPFSGFAQAGQVDPLNQQISWPDAIPDPDLSSQDPPDQSFSGAGAIPDDWDDDLLSEPKPADGIASAPGAVKPSIPLTQPPVVPRPVSSASQHPEHGVSASIDGPSFIEQKELELEQANAKIQVELEVLKQQIVSQQRGSQSEVTVDTTLVDALGFKGKNLVDAEITQINQLAGEVLREMVKGLMQVLGSRSTIKNEFRMNVTTIQPVENNPLKFSANIDDALENMFLKQGNAYKKPIEAVKEGFEGVAEHQIAILAGIREAFKAVIQRFDPVLLEERFSKQSKGGLKLGSQKARNWDSYLDYYNELVGDIDKSFQYLYGDGFVRAYEDQLQKLAISRKSSKFTGEK